MLLCSPKKSIHNTGYATLGRDLSNGPLILPMLRSGTQRMRMNCASGLRSTDARESKHSARDNRRNSVCSPRKVIGPIFCAWTSQAPDWILLFPRTSLQPSFAPSQMKVAPFFSPHVCSRRSREFRIILPCCIKANSYSAGGSTISRLGGLPFDSKLRNQSRRLSGHKAISRWRIVRKRSVCPKQAGH